MNQRQFEYLTSKKLHLKSLGEISNTSMLGYILGAKKENDGFSMVFMFHASSIFYLRSSPGIVFFISSARCEKTSYVLFN